MSETIGTTTETVATTQTAEDLATELQRARDALKAANRESAERRKKLDEYEQAEQKRREAELSETEKLNQRLQEAEQAKAQALATANDRLIRAAFVAAAAQHGAEHPADAYLLADRTNVTVDESGNVTGVTEAVKALVDGKRLTLRGRTVPNMDAGSGNNQGERQAALTEEELRVARRLGVKPEDYAANKRRTQ